jgi:hypothetical protein
MGINMVMSRTYSHDIPVPIKITVDIVGDK